MDVLGGRIEDKPNKINAYLAVVVYHGDRRFSHRAKDELLTVGGLHGRGLTKKTNDMKRITLHLTACMLFAPCLLAFTSGCLLANAAGTLYAGCLVYMSGHTAKGRKFTRKYYREVLRLEKLLSE